MDFERREKIFGTIMLVLFTAAVTFVITVFGVTYYRDNIRISENTRELDEKLELVRRYIDKYYFGEIDEEKLREGAVKGFVDGLGDRFTRFLTPEELETTMNAIRGDFVGIGIYMQPNREGYVVVMSPIENSPAEEVGLRPGDIILTVDGVEIRGMDLTLVSSKIMGEERTVVELVISRDGERIEKRITRRQIIVASVRSGMLENDIGYIEIASFGTRSADEFEKQLNELQAQGMRSLIIDLRSNGGGTVDSALQIADLLVPRNRILMVTANRDGNEIVTARSGNSIDIPVVILVDRLSASASEILAGALRDNNVGTLIGETTFGKGSVQSIREICEIGAISVTTAEFKTPNGDPINEVGIEPDIVVEYVRDSGIDEQLNRAIEYLMR
ncbi:MAG: S41 family peptidase [Oscillospiraceae bacterium]|nr:S41 family peptidase [Oscillospiraceae bacterium]